MTDQMMLWTVIDTLTLLGHAFHERRWQTLRLQIQIPESAGALKALAIEFGRVSGEIMYAKRELHTMAGSSVSRKEIRAMLISMIDDILKETDKEADQ